MNDDIAKEWTKALRSGKYKQGDMFLCRNDKWCCLGVLCDLYAKDHDIPIKTKTKTDFVDDEETITSFDGIPDVLPSVVLKWAGMSSVTGQYMDPEVGYEFSLAALNDEGHSFSDLADIIEEYWMHL